VPVAGPDAVSDGHPGGVEGAGCPTRAATSTVCASAILHVHRGAVFERAGNRVHAYPASPVDSQPRSPSTAATSPWREVRDMVVWASARERRCPGECGLGGLPRAHPPSQRGDVEPSGGDPRLRGSEDCGHFDEKDPQAVVVTSCAGTGSRGLFRHSAIIYPIDLAAANVQLNGLGVPSHRQLGQIEREDARWGKGTPLVSRGRGNCCGWVSQRARSVFGGVLCTSGILFGLCGPGK
jgi:hypothetical protein